MSPKKFIDSWNTFFHDFDIEETSDTRCSEVSRTDVAVPDKHHSNISHKADPDHCVNVLDVCYANKSKLMDIFITKDAFLGIV